MINIMQMIDDYEFGSTPGAVTPGVRYHGGELELSTIVLHTSSYDYWDEGGIYDNKFQFVSLNIPKEIEVQKIWKSGDFYFLKTPNGKFYRHRAIGGMSNRYTGHYDISLRLKYDRCYWGNTGYTDNFFEIRIIPRKGSWDHLDRFIGSLSDLQVRFDNGDFIEQIMLHIRIDVDYGNESPLHKDVDELIQTRRMSIELSHYISVQVPEIFGHFPLTNQSACLPDMYYNPDITLGYYTLTLRDDEDTYLEDEDNFGVYVYPFPTLRLKTSMFFTVKRAKYAPYARSVYDGMHFVETNALFTKQSYPGTFFKRWKRFKQLVFTGNPYMCIRLLFRFMRENINSYELQFLLYFLKWDYAPFYLFLIDIDKSINELFNDNYAEGFGSVENIHERLLEKLIFYALTGKHADWLYANKTSFPHHALSTYCHFKLPAMHDIIVTTSK